MTHSCSLDEFIEKNRKEVRADPFSPPIEFPQHDYKVPPGALFDVRVLRGEGYLLQANNLKEDAQINPADIGIAALLDKEGRDMGYQLVQHGSRKADGSWFSAYFIEKNPRGPADKDTFERYRDVREKFGDVLYGPVEP